MATMTQEELERRVQRLIDAIMPRISTAFVEISPLTAFAFRSRNSPTQRLIFSRDASGTLFCSSSQSCASSSVGMRMTVKRETSASFSSRVPA